MEDITGIPIRDDHAKSVLVGFLDPQTRAQIASKFGQTTTFMELKSAVMGFANSMGGPEPMQLDRFQGEEEDEEKFGGWTKKEWKSWDEEGAVGKEDPDLRALGRNIQCYTCSGYGHAAKDCPSKGKSKGKGKEPVNGKGSWGKSGWQKGERGGKGDWNKGKGKGKSGPKGGCFICGGDHYKDQCPQGFQKGKGKGLKSLEEWSWGNWGWNGGEGSVRSLSTLKSIVPNQPSSVYIQNAAILAQEKGADATNGALKKA